MPRVKIGVLRAGSSDFLSESARLKNLVLATRQIQHQRLGKNRTNSEMSSKECDQLIKLDDSAKKFIDNIMAKSLISARGYYRVLKTAQTAADLENSAVVSEKHLAEVFNCRLRDE